MPPREEQTPSLLPAGSRGGAPSVCPLALLLCPPPAAMHGCHTGAVLGRHHRRSLSGMGLPGCMHRKTSTAAQDGLLPEWTVKSDSDIFKDGLCHTDEEPSQIERASYYPLK